MKIKDFRLARLEFDEQTNILYYRVNQDQEIDIEEMGEMIEYVKGFIGERKHLALIDFGGSLTSTPEARKQYADDPYIKAYRIADAFLVKSVSVRILANFFIKVTKPKVKTKLFSDEVEAVKWLHKLAVLEDAS